MGDERDDAVDGPTGEQVPADEAADGGVAAGEGASGPEDVSPAVGIPIAIAMVVLMVLGAVLVGLAGSDDSRTAADAVPGGGSDATSGGTSADGGDGGSGSKATTSSTTSTTAPAATTTTVATTVPTAPTTTTAPAGPDFDPALVAVAQDPGACVWSLADQELRDAGTVRNDNPVSGVVEVQTTWSDASGEIDSDSAVLSLDPGETQRWETSSSLADTAPNGLTCAVEIVQ